MQKLYRLGMQSLSSNQLPARRTSPPVEGVGDDRVADRGQMDADLVRAAGLREGPNQAVLAQSLDHFIASSRHSPLRPNRHLLALHRVPSDRLIDDAALRLGRADDEGQVLLVNLPRTELPPKRRQGSCRARDEEDARGVLVEAVEDAE
jgi:hypothetical protein